ncbi:MAG: M56 family metallopeptidase [Saprospiraceae bacterium]|nr:M56 family metallopeptidase [Saprospiraceae bacterium]
MTHWLEFLGHDTIQALGWTFVHTLWQGSLLALLMMVLISRVPASNAVRRYHIAFGTLIAMLASAVTTFLILNTDTGTAAAYVQQGVLLPAPENTTSGLTAWLNANLDLLVTIWVIGMLILLVRMGVGLLYIERLKRSAVPIGNAMQALGQRIARQLGYQRSARIAQTAMVNIPVVVGYFKPMILFPVGAINQLSAEEVEAVLAHELAHLVRNDFVQNLVQSLIEIIFYYHPAVWWISAVVRAERENCCDDLAVRACGSSLTYARALVQLQDLGGSSPALALPLSGPRHHLLHRIQRILNQPQNKSNVMEKVTATALLALCLILASFTGDRDSATQIDTPDAYLHYEQMVIDTVPVSGKVIIHRTINGEEAELVYHNGKVKSFKLGGEVIPESAYGEHQGLIDELLAEATDIPKPPAPPAPPAAPDALPALPAPGAPATIPAPSVPDAPPPPPIRKGEYLHIPPPPPPPAPARVKKRTETLILRETDDQGNTVYRIESDGEGKSSIVIDEAASVARIDGQEIIIDADSIIVIEEVETELPFGQVWAPRMLLADSMHIKLGEHYLLEPRGNISYQVAPHVLDNIRVREWQQAWPKIEAGEHYEKALKLYNESLNSDEIKKHLEKGQLQFDQTWKEYAEQLEEMNVEFNKQFKWDVEQGLWNDELGQLQRDAEQGDAGQRAKAKAEIARKLKEREASDKALFYQLQGDAPLGNMEPPAVLFAEPNVFTEIAQGDGNFAFALMGKGHQGRILGEMEREGLIDADSDYSVVLTEKKLKINGKKMPDDTLEKYKKIFRKVYGHDISGKTKIEFSNE